MLLNIKEVKILYNTVKRNYYAHFIEEKNEIHKS